MLNINVGYGILMKVPTQASKRKQSAKRQRE